MYAMSSCVTFRIFFIYILDVLIGLSFDPDPDHMLVSLCLMIHKGGLLFWNQSYQMVNHQQGFSGLL